MQMISEAPPWKGGKGRKVKIQTNKQKLDVCEVIHELIKLFSEGDMRERLISASLSVQSARRMSEVCLGEIPLSLNAD